MSSMIFEDGGWRQRQNWRCGLCLPQLGPVLISICFLGFWLHWLPPSTLLVSFYCHIDNPESPWKREPQWMNCSDPICLWPCLWELVLMDDWCRGLGLLFLGRQAGPWLNKKAAEHEPGSQVLSSVPPWPLHWAWCADLPQILFCGTLGRAGVEPALSQYYSPWLVVYR